MDKINWKFIQQNSDSILADGLWQLIKRPFESCNEITHNDFGNYLISYDEKAYYIGEAQDICKRLKQQFKPKTSTFYKNYQKHLTNNKDLNTIAIDSFRIQHISTQLGRKEVEEFGIVNLPTIINSFQLEKRNKYKISYNNGIWDEVQKLKSELLKEGEKEILKSTFKSWSENVVSPNPGLYIVRDKDDQLIYIGESSNIRERYLTHGGKKAYFSALRRHIATEILSFELKERNGKKKYLTEAEERAVTLFLQSCNSVFYHANFGRCELEEYLIKKHKPLLNRKGNKED
jgi:predicted GIY-YIG superfamily endonuclease